MRRRLIYNHLVPDFTMASLCATKLDGGMNIRGVGYPYRRFGFANPGNPSLSPPFRNEGGEVVGRNGSVFRPCDGY